MYQFKNLWVTSVFDVSKMLPCGVTRPADFDPISNPLWYCNKNSSRLDEIIGSSIITIRFVFDKISLKAALGKAKLGDLISM